MSALKNYIFVICLASTYARIPYIDFLVGTRCINKANETGICEFYENCQHLLDKFKKHQIKQEDIFKCNEQGIICCTPDAPITSTTKASVNRFANDHEVNKVGKISEEKCKEYSKSTKTITKVAGTFANPQPIETIVDNCKHKSSQLVVGGKEAYRFEFPHQALLGYERDNSYDWVCGGSLISPQFILTAAHCKFNEVVESKNLKAYNTTTARLGMISRTESDNDTLIYSIEKFIINHNFNSFSKRADIALVKLTENVQISEKIHPICLPIKEYENTKAIVTGFGRTNDSNEDVSESLMKATLEKYNDTSCQYYYNGKIDNSTMMCFGSSSTTNVIDSCNGDSGGPLQIQHENIECSYIQIGIVSFGNRNCNIQGHPGVYVNVFHFIDWIENIVWPNE